MHCLYECRSTRCRRYRQPFTSSTPAERRAAVGRPVLCPDCGQVAWFLDLVPETSAEVQAVKDNRLREHE